MSEKLQKLELTWPGKDERFNPEPRILLEDTGKSYSKEPTEEGPVQPTFDNMLIHGDNLLALKALEQDYTGKVKCIYIDPPYNTGNAFEHYDDGLEHSIWLSLMRDRLEILRKLLSDDGVIFVQIDDNEQAYLKVLMDEIFGRNNFISTITLKMSTASGVKTAHKEKTIIKEKEFILVYARNSEFIHFKPQYIPTNEVNSEFQYFLDRNNSEDAGDWNVKNLKDVIKEQGVLSENYEKFLNENADKIWRRAFIRNEYKELSQQNPNKIFHVKKDNTEHIYYRGREMYFLKDQFHDCFTEDGHKYMTSHLLGDFWSDINTGKLFNEGGVEFRNSKKPEFLIARIIDMSTNHGDLVLDSFLGSGTTCAVAHKMGRRWIGVEMGNHVYTHCIPRLTKVINGEDQGGITKATGWKNGGGFKFYELASSLIVKDRYGQQVISDKYNADMLAEAMCKILDYHYKPDKEKYWKQGFSSEKSFIYTTTMSMQETSLSALAEEVGDNNLLICCSAFRGNTNAYPNISVKKIPAAILKKCEWGATGYPFLLKDYHPKAEDFEFNEEE